MKINMWKLLIVALIASTALVGCKDERDNFMVDDTISFINTENYATVSVYNEKYDFPVMKNGKGFSGATAHLTVSETALDEYNAANATNYVTMPENCYKFSATTLKFAKDDLRKIVELSWDETAVLALDKSKDYVVPVQLSVDNGSVQVSEGLDLLIVHPKLSSVSMEKTLAASLLPSAAGDAISCDGNVVLDNPISVMDVTVNFTIDNSLIAAYNEANGTDYKAAPDGFATMASATSQIAAGQTSAPFTCNFDSDLLFAGSELKVTGNMLVPIRISSTSVDGLGISNGVMYVPFTMDKELKGPWTLLEGEENCYARDPNNGGAAWIMQYTADKLFDGEITAGHEWISWFATQIEFPITFVVDMGTRQVFTNFLISDYSTHQGNLREYEIYTAEEYDGENTQWNLVASGKRSYYGWTGVATVYDYPVQKYFAGRYLKFQIMKAESTVGDYLYGRGKLADVQGVGF